MGRPSLAPALLLAACTTQDVNSLAGLPARQEPLHDQCQSWDRKEERPLLDVRADFGRIVTKTSSTEALDPKLQKKLKKSEATFREEGARQIKLVQDAGGYCALPVIDTTSSHDGEFSDNRLGNKLFDIHQKAYDVVPAEAPIRLDWSVNLDRADCSYGADELTLDTVGASPALLDTYGQWVNLSAELQGGFDTHKLKDNPKLAAQLLVQRGRDLLAEVDEGEASKLQTEWKVACAPTESADTPLTSLQEEQFLGSYLLSKAVLQDETAARWTVPYSAGEGIRTDLGYNRDQLCGQVYRCESKGAPKEYMSVQ